MGSHTATGKKSHITKSNYKLTHVIHIVFSHEAQDTWISISHESITTDKRNPTKPSIMLTSSNGNIFRVTDHLRGEFTGQFPTQRPVTWSFDVFFDLRLDKQLSKQL